MWNSNFVFITLFLSSVYEQNSIHHPLGLSIPKTKVKNSEHQDIWDHVHTTKFLEHLVRNTTHKEFHKNETFLTPRPVSSDDLVSGRSMKGTIERKNLLPPWMNFTLALQGQQFARNNIFSMVYLAAHGLGVLLTIPDVKNILLFTSNSDTHYEAYGRYAATGVQAILWIEDTLKYDPNYNAIFTSILQIRQIHINVAKRANQHGYPFRNPYSYQNISTDNFVWSMFKTDLNKSNIPQSQRLFSNKYLENDTNPIPVNQFSLAITQFAFMGYVILNPSQGFLYNVSDDDLQGYVHLWAVFGYALGIDDKYNICLQPDISSTKSYFQDIQMKYYNPSLFNLDHGSKVLIEALAGVNGFNNFIPGLSLHSLLLRYLRDILEIPVPNLMGSLKRRDKMGEQLFENLIIPFAHKSYFQQSMRVLLMRSLSIFYKIAFGGSQVTNMKLAQRFYYRELRNGFPL